MSIALGMTRGEGENTRKCSSSARRYFATFAMAIVETLMRRCAFGAVVCAGIVICGSGKARSDPLPVAILGAWSPVPGCPVTAPRVTLAAHQLTVYEGNGVTDIVKVDASGKVADKLQIRVTAVPEGTRSDSEGPHVGDIIFFKLDDKGLNMVGPMKAGDTHTQSPAMLLMRCK